MGFIGLKLYNKSSFIIISLISSSEGQIKDTRIVIK